MKQYGMNGTADQCEGIPASLTAGDLAQASIPALVWAEYGETLPTQSNAIGSIASGMRGLYDDIIRQPLPARIRELASFLMAKESWQ